jgi:hypothetical protein
VSTAVDYSPLWGHRAPWRVVLGPADLPKFRNRKGAPPTRQLPVKNRYFTVNPHTKRIVPSSSIKRKLGDGIVAAMFAATGGAPPRFSTPVRLTLIQYAPRQHATGPLAGQPLLDSDACLAAVRDALEHIGVVPKDAYIIGDRTEVRYRKGQPGLEIEVAPI